MNLIELFSFAFIQRAVIGGILVAILAAIMGVLMVLKRASFFSDAVAHSSLAGVALGLLLKINPILCAMVYSISVALMLPQLEKKSRIPIDSLLGFLLPFSMSIGVILLAILPGYRPELMSYLFGNILAISWTDLAIVGMTVIIIFGLMIRHWRKLVFVAFDKTYAKISGLNVEQIDIWFNIALAITVVLGIKLVGIVLINALLVIPALILRMFARSMKSMLIWTPVVSCVITLLGILISFVINLPTGPVITLTAGVIFLISVLLSQFRFARHKL